MLNLNTQKYHVGDRTVDMHNTIEMHKIMTEKRREHEQKDYRKLSSRFL